MCANANDNQAVFSVSHYRVYNIGIPTIQFFEFNPFAPGDFAKKRVLKLVEWFSGHCRAIKS